MRIAYFTTGVREMSARGCRGRLSSRHQWAVTARRPSRDQPVAPDSSAETHGALGAFSHTTTKIRPLKTTSSQCALNSLKSDAVCPRENDCQCRVFESVRTLGVDLRFLPTGLGNREISRVGAAVRALPRLEESVLRVYDCGCSSTIEG